MSKIKEEIKEEIKGAAKRLALIRKSKSAQVFNLVHKIGHVSGSELVGLMHPGAKNNAQTYNILRELQEAGYLQMIRKKRPKIKLNKKKQSYPPLKLTSGYKKLLFLEKTKKEYNINGYTSTTKYIEDIGILTNIPLPGETIPIIEENIPRLFFKELEQLPLSTSTNEDCLLDLYVTLEVIITDRLIYAIKAKKGKPPYSEEFYWLIVVLRSRIGEILGLPDTGMRGLDKVLYFLIGKKVGGGVAWVK